MEISLLRSSSIFCIYLAIWLVSVGQSESSANGDPTHPHGSDEALQRKRQNVKQAQWMWEGREAAVRVLSAAESTLDSVADNLEELWNRESARAASEVERLLQGAIGSMPQPTAVPISRVPVTMMPILPHPVTPAPASSNTDCLLGRNPEQYLLDEMLQVTNVNLLLDPSTPQGMAFNFILEDPTARMDLCGFPTLAQRYGMGTFHCHFGFCCHMSLSRWRCLLGRTQHQFTIQQQEPTGQRIQAG